MSKQQQQVDKSQVFEKENQILSYSKSVLKKPVEELSVNTLREEYEQLSQSYAQLLGEVKLLTSVSDRLQNKLDKANDNVNKKETELDRAMTVMTKFKTTNTVTNIVFILFVALFFIVDWTIDTADFLDDDSAIKITKLIIDYPSHPIPDIPDYMNTKNVIATILDKPEQIMEIVIKLVIIFLLIPIRLFLTYLMRKVAPQKQNVDMTVLE
jgi:hypothetical protein